jgi:hypothetical protein
MNKMNGASGASDIEGKAATGSGEKAGRASFNSAEASGSSNSAYSVQESLPNSKKVHVSGTLHKDIRAPFREFRCPEKSMKARSK